MPDAAPFTQVALLKDVGRGTALLACGDCLDGKLCGGLHLPAGTVSSCLDYCRCITEAQRSECPAVCPRKPADLVKRIGEVVTFDLNNIPATRKLSLPRLPHYVPLIHGRSAGGKGHEEQFIALPMSHALVGRGPSTRARTARELAVRTGLRPGSGWVLSGTEDDRFVERFWGLPDLSRVFEGMRRAGVVFATSPNFSLTNEVPRHDNLHAMKRIGWIWHHMQQAGIPTALHINGRTDRDFERWAEFVRKRSAVNAVAFEFLTGALPTADRERYIERLREFARLVGRKVHLVLRGSNSVAPQLRTSFSGVTVIDSCAYQRAVHRRQAFVDEQGQVRYEPVVTERRSQVAALFSRNNDIMRVSFDPLAKRQESSRDEQIRLPFWAPVGAPQPVLPAQGGADDKPLQGNLFPT